MTMILFDLGLKLSDHSAAASGSTPMLNLRSATAARKSANVSNGTPGSSHQLSCQPAPSFQFGIDVTVCLKPDPRSETSLIL